MEILIKTLSVTEIKRAILGETKPKNTLGYDLILRKVLSETTHKYLKYIIQIINAALRLKY